MGVKLCSRMSSHLHYLVSKECRCRKSEIYLKVKVNGNGSLTFDFAVPASIHNKCIANTFEHFENLELPKLE